jgi:hypothetical protein
MSFNKKSTVVVAALALAISTSLTGCFGSSDKTTDAVKDAATKGTETVKDAATKGTDAVKAGGAALTGAALTKVVSEAKTPLVQANSAIKTGDVAKAKTMIEKFDGVWTKVSPQIKLAAGDKFGAIETGVEAVKTAAATGDKAKIGTALTAAIKGMDGLTAAKKK